MDAESPNQLASSLLGDGMNLSQKFATTLDDFEILNKIGKGSFGTVYKIKRKADNNIYVLKQIGISHLSPQARNSAVNEVQILASLRNPYIVKYYESFVDRSHLNIVMEYCEGGDLDSYIKKHVNRLIPEKRIWKMFIQLLVGLHYIHKKNIVHRDLKTLNVFVTKEEDIRIGDMGLAKVLDCSGKFAHSVVGTPYFISPEICERKPYNDKTDIWSLGCILYELCTLRHAFEATSHAALLLKIVRSQQKPISETYSKELAEIIDGCLCKDPEARYSTMDLLTMKVVMQKAKVFDIDIERILGIELKPSERIITEKKLSAPNLDQTPSRTFSQGFLDVKNEKNTEEVSKENGTKGNKAESESNMFTTQRNFADKRKKNPVSLSVDKLLKEQYQNERTVSSTNNLFKLYFDKQRVVAQPSQREKDASESPLLSNLENKSPFHQGKAFEGTDFSSAEKMLAAKYRTPVRVKPNLRDEKNADVSPLSHISEKFQGFQPEKMAPIQSDKPLRSVILTKLAVFKLTHISFF